MKSIIQRRPVVRANVDDTVKRVKKSQHKFSKYNQKQVDKIFKEVALTANEHRIDIAKWVHEETQMGVLEDKVTKNHFASEYIYNKYKDMPTVGTIETDEQHGYTSIADPIGIVMGICPVTNPSSTIIFKVLIALKTRNCIILSPHPRAYESSVELCKLLKDAAVRAGAPDDCIAWTEPANAPQLAHHQDVSLILATGGKAMVKAAYSSGKPAIGVGPGDTPVVFHKSADIPMAVHNITLSKTFDNGMICASEQVLVAETNLMDDILVAFAEQGAYCLTEDEAIRVAALIFNNHGQMSPETVGQSAYHIATRAGVGVPENTTILIAETTHDGVFTAEKLCPVLGAVRTETFEETLEISRSIIERGGLGHTMSLYCAEKSVIDSVQAKIPVVRVLVNMPSAHGAIGDLYNFRLEPSLTLGCGTFGGNSVSDNVGPKHLLNYKKVIETRENMQWFKVPGSVYFKSGILSQALKDLKGVCSRVQIVTDETMRDIGYVSLVTVELSKLGIETNVFTGVPPDPTIECVEEGIRSMRAFEADAIVAIGGGSPMDAAKIMRVLYEHPEQDFRQLTVRFMDIMKRIVEFPNHGDTVKRLVCIPTTSGTGAEVTPFAVIKSSSGRKYPIADYALTPDIAIVDPQLCLSMPPGLTAMTGLDALTHAIESYVSVFANDYTQGYSLRAAKLIFRNLEAAFRNPEDLSARENVHNASTLAGMAFGNAFLGVCHSIAHQLGHVFGIPHGLANAMLITHVIRYNATKTPTKRTAFAQYRYKTVSDYAEIARYCGVSNETDDEEQMVADLITAIECLKDALAVPESLKAYGVSETDFNQNLDRIALMAYDDQCTGANPRQPLIHEIKEILLNAY